MRGIPPRAPWTAFPDIENRETVRMGGQMHGVYSLSFGHTTHSVTRSRPLQRSNAEQVTQPARSRFCNSTQVTGLDKCRQRPECDARGTPGGSRRMDGTLRACLCVTSSSCAGGGMASMATLITASGCV
jgi:hypothetical protein